MHAPELLPNLYCRDIASVPFHKLAEQGIVNICIDLDNTLALRRSDLIEQHILDTLSKARQAGFIQKICVVSNIIFGKKRFNRVKNAAAQLQTPYFFAAHFFNRKPFAAPFLKAMEQMNSKPENTAMIGDQIFTDIIGGNRAGLYTILVVPLGNDHWVTGFTGRRRREKRILKDLFMHQQ
ncbi:YqeG family HAD IIIA-type phosphatase [bacterium]|nr:YqeG family HAD IIIA-type phosphatase [bacterium]